MLALERILVPVDFSETSELALTYGMALAAQFGASLHVLHVLDDSLLAFYTSEALGMSLLDIRNELEKDATTRLAAILTEEDRQRLRAVVALRMGQASSEIIRYATEERIDLIAMGTHGRGPVSHMLMGSVAEKVVRRGVCPVLTIKHPEHEFVMP